MPTRGSAGKYCKLACHSEKTKNEKPHWFECSRCLASVGLGAGKTGKLIGKTKQSVWRSWRRLGVNSAKIQFPKTCGWWGSSDTGKAWMQQHKEKFFDWSSIWITERSNRMSTQYYNSPEKIYERACYRDILLHRFKTIYPDWSLIWTRSRSSMSGERRAIDNLRNRFKGLMGTTKRGGSSFRSGLIGCTTEQFRAHIESQFKSWMTWDNYGTRWHIDHILPCASFDHTDAAQVRQCWHWTNLRPLCAKKNMQKSDEITEPQMHLLLEHH